MTNRSDREEYAHQCAREAAARVAAAGPYKLREDPLDPGWMILRGAVSAMVEQTDRGITEAAERALDDLYHLIALPLTAVPSRALVMWCGPPGQRIEAGWKLADQAGQPRASTTVAIHLGQAVFARGIAPGRPAADLNGRLLRSPPEVVAADADAFDAIEIGLDLPRAPDFPGALWDLPGVLSRRLRAVRVAGEGVCWKYDPCGRIFVPPQRLPEAALARGGGEAGLVWLAFDLPLAAGTLRFCGRCWANVTEAETADTTVLVSHVLRQPLEEGEDITLAQPFRGWSGRPAEREDCWRRRIAERLRHRDAAVTPDDYQALAAEFCPQVHVLEVAATRVPGSEGMRDAVRVTVVPRDWDSVPDLFDQAWVLAGELARHLTGRTPVGVHAVVGPPALAWAVPPACDNPLWCHRASLACAGEAVVCRDGLYWPVYSLAELERRLA